MMSSEKSKIQQGSSSLGQVYYPSGLSSSPSTSYGVTKPVPMKLFSSWEVDRTPPNCIPRLCSLTLIRLVVLRALPTSEASAIIVAVKMAGSRRTLRSNEIQLSSNGLTDTELDLHFSLQYPHFLKREENKLVVMLQRRKRYKNRTILGYKTLAEGSIDMALVLQKSLDLELHLFSPEGNNKENSLPLGRVTILGLSSQPVDDVEGERKSKQGKSRSGGGHDFSDDEDDFSSHSSDSPPDDVILRKNSKSLPHNRNLKQRIVNLLRKFKATEERNECKTGEPVENVDIQELFDELEGLSDSEPDADTMSVGSFPRPVLRPFFSSSRSLVHQNSGTGIGERHIPTSDERADSDSWTEEQDETSASTILAPQLSISLPPPQNVNGKGVRISKLGSIADQCSILEDGFPDLVVFLWLDGPGSQIFTSLANCNLKVIGITNEGDVRVALQYLVAKLQKFCNNNSKTPQPVTIVVAGNETLLSGVTKNYTQQLSSKPHDWQSYFAFLYIPFSSGGSVWKLLCQGDPNYAQSFNDYTERGDPEDFTIRLLSYIKLATDRRLICYVPIAEAMITYKENQESSQVFVPFVSDVRLSVGYSSPSVEGDGGVGGTDLSASPPSPPHSPREEPLELQVDYWKGTIKSSVKAFFRSLTIQRTYDNLLSVSYVLKEQKKQKIMRLGKKKETDLKNQSLDGISRLVCLARSHAPIKLFVDGGEWPGVKFFQVSSQWQSQVKSLPLLISQGKGENK